MLFKSPQSKLTPSHLHVLYFWLLCRGFSSVPGPNLSAASFETSEESSRSIHTKTKLNHTNNITKYNFILNVQIFLFKQNEVRSSKYNHYVKYIATTSTGKTLLQGSVARTDC